MEVLQQNNLLLILVLVIFNIASCLARCENDLGESNLLGQGYTESQCNGIDGCYKEVVNEILGQCYKNSEKKVTHLGEDCIYSIPITQVSQSLQISADYLDAAFSTVVLEGSFPENAFKHCESIDCHLVLYDELNDQVYFKNDTEMIEANHLSSDDSDRRYLFFFAPRCESQPPNIKDVCTIGESAEDNTVLTISYEQGTILSDIHDFVGCARRCLEDRLCSKYKYYYDDQICTVWFHKPIPVQSASIPICVIEPLAGVITPGEAAHHQEQDELILDKESFLSTSRDTTDCWTECARNPSCEGISVRGNTCNIHASDPRRSSGSNRPESFFYIGKKKLRNETACDYGKIANSMMEFNSDSLACKNLGLCHKDIGIPDSPSTLCYLAEDRTSTEQIDMGNGRLLTVIVEWENPNRGESFFENSFLEVVPTQNWETCLRACSNKTCFGLAMDSSDPNAGCRLALEPFALSHSEETETINRRVAFVKHQVKMIPADEICQGQDELPENWQFGSALYFSHIIEDVSGFQECEAKCNRIERECSQTVIFRPDESQCLIFESREIFAQDSDISYNVNLDLQSDQQCIVKPSDGGRFRPTTIKFVYPWSSEKLISAEPVERVRFSTYGWKDPENVCWIYCSQLPWCLSVHIGKDGCLLYDRIYDTLVPPPAGERGARITIMADKQFTDEHICERGGIIKPDYFDLFGSSKASCNFLHICHQEYEFGSSTFSLCYYGREVQPEPIRANSHCPATPFFTSEQGFMGDIDSISYYSYAFLSDVDTYEDCVRLCSWDKACIGLYYIPSTKECGKIESESGLITLFRSSQTQAREYFPNLVECQMALIVPHCVECVRRVLMQEQIVYKDELQCSHTYTESCSDVYQTVFKTQEVEECKESFEKNCHIEYEMVPRSEKVEMCHSPLTRDCNEEGPETCSTEYETVCDTTYHENEVTDDVASCTTVKEDVCDYEGENCRMVPRQVCQVDTVSSKKLTPEMDCRQEAREVCGPEICPIVQGERICVDELKTFVLEVPQEKCQISPKTVCDKVHKIVPKLEMNQECIDVPQESCQRVQVEANKETIPIVKEWCPPAEEESAEEDMSGEGDSSSSSEEDSSSSEEDSSSSEESSSVEDDAPRTILRDREAPSLLEELAIAEHGSRGSRGHGPSAFDQYGLD